ncbi:dephospho-CoA kinase [Batrachochytrium salamandrivorans]|nr:dephospho-CoA kinase [Batrachochytrium salamandrivorans]
MRIVGLTGGIATGKSTVSTILAKRKAAYYAICDTFGSVILNPDGTINRQLLGALVFANTEQRQQLNCITHPYIRFELLKRVLWLFLSGEQLCVVDTPLLFEARLNRWVHTTVVVYCPESIQKERLMHRDGSSPEQAQQRIDSQLPIDQKRDLADYIIDNSGLLESTRQQAMELMQHLAPSHHITMCLWVLLFFPVLWLYIMLLSMLGVDHWIKRINRLSVQLYNYLTSFLILETAPQQQQKKLQPADFIAPLTNLDEISLPPAAEPSH